MVRIDKNNISINTDTIPISGGIKKDTLNTVFGKDTTAQISDINLTGLTVETVKVSPKGSTNTEHLKNAPNPIITVAGEENFASMVVDVKNNLLYKYDENGKAIIVYSVATGKKSLPTRKGIRKIDHVEDYPYKTAYGTKRKKNPKAYGPNVLYLVSIDPKTGKVTGSNGQFIHGNNNEKSLGTHASLGCIRMDNDVIKEIAKEDVKDLYVLIQ